MEDWEIALTVSATILVAVSGYFFTYFNSRRLERRKDRLQRVNEQLQEFHGPLYSLSQTSMMAWDAFRETHPNLFNGDSDSSAEDYETWRLWVSEVFMPLNLRMQEVIIQRSDLLDDAELPRCLLQLSAHVSAYTAILKRWKSSDFSRQGSPVHFPREELEQYTTSAYLRLKGEQDRLLGYEKGRLGPAVREFSEMLREQVSGRKR